MAATILLVEDEATNQEVALLILRHQGWNTVVAMNGEEALSLAHTLQPQLILMDLLMPVMDGLEATRRLKADEATRHIPVVAVTAKASQNDRQEAEAAGCAGFLTKPYRNKALVEVVRHHLGEPAPEA